MDIAFGPTGIWYVQGIKRDGSGDHSWWSGGANLSAEIEEHASKPHELKVSFGSDSYGNESCALVYGRNGFATSNLDDDLFSRIKRINKRKKAINFVRLFNDGGYFISDDEGTEWKNVAEHCSKELKGNGKVEEFSKAGDDSWVVLRPNSFVCSTGVDSNLEDHLQRFYREQKARNQQRQREIREYHERVQREARESAERAAAAVRERAEREAREAAAFELADRERAVRLVREAEERERTMDVERERVAREARERAAIALETEIVAEVRSIRELDEHLCNRKRALEASFASLPPARRIRFERNGALVTYGTNGGEDRAKRECVVCQDRPPARAVIPCGHHCLCDECAERLVSVGSGQCPLCRENVHSTLKIFSN
jgi:hypothetical protein